MSESVRVLARWDGFCLSCAVDERPLVLTMTGPSGMGAWWQGGSWHDRDLHLTCAVCGRVESVAWNEADDVVQVDDWQVLDLPAAVAVSVPAAEPEDAPSTYVMAGAAVDADAQAHVDAAVVEAEPAPQTVSRPRAVVLARTHNVPSPSALPVETTDEVLDLLEIGLSLAS